MDVAKAVIAGVLQPLLEAWLLLPVLALAFHNSCRRSNFTDRDSVYSCFK